jgi:hypothetical protein
MAHRLHTFVKVGSKDFAECFNPFAVEGHKMRPSGAFAKHGTKAPLKGASCAILHRFNHECTIFYNKS